MGDTKIATGGDYYFIFEASSLHMNFLSNLVFSFNRYASSSSSSSFWISMSVDYNECIYTDAVFNMYVMLSFFISFQCAMFINNEINPTKKKERLLWKTDCNLSYYRDQDSLLSLKSFFILKLKLTSQSVSLCCAAFHFVHSRFCRLFMTYMFICLNCEIFWHVWSLIFEFY